MLFEARLRKGKRQRTANVISVRRILLVVLHAIIVPRFIWLPQMRVGYEVWRCVSRAGYPTPNNGIINESSRQLGGTPQDSPTRTVDVNRSARRLKVFLRSDLNKHVLGCRIVLSGGDHGVQPVALRRRRRELRPPFGSCFRHGKRLCGMRFHAGFGIASTGREYPVSLRRVYMLDENFRLDDAINYF